jgi:signal transduction histidine kinase
VVIVLVPIVELFGTAALTALAAFVVVWMRPWNTNHAWWNLPERLIASGVNALEHKLVDSVEHWIDPPATRFAHWLDGVASVMTGTGDSALAAAHAIEQALVYVANVKLPRLVNEARHDLGKLIAEAEAEAVAALHWAQVHVGELRGDFEAFVSHVRHEVEAPLDYLLNTAVPALRRDVGAVAHEVDDVVLPRLGHLGGEVASVEDLLKGWEHKLDDAHFWEWVASAGGLLALVKLIEAEAGLGRAECRRKVGGICTTDPTAWFDLLAGLAAIGFAFSIEDVIRVGIEAVHEAEPLIDELVA